MADAPRAAAAPAAAAASGGAGREVRLNVYDVVPPAADDLAETASRPAALTRLNNLTRNLFGGVGGVFHGAIVIGDDEYSFGYCENGSGVYKVRAGENPMYTFRETLALGPTLLDDKEILAAVYRLKKEWAGSSYDLLNRNCCHFCDVLAVELGVDPVPAWLNRFATTGAAAMQATNDASTAMRAVRDELTRVSNESYSWVKASVAKAAEQISGAAQSGGGKAPVLASQVGGALRAAARGLQVALNGPEAGGGGRFSGGAEPSAAAAAIAAAVVSGAGASVQTAPAAAKDSAKDPSAAAAAAEGGAGSEEGFDEDYLPTTALRWGSAGAAGGGGGGAGSGSGGAPGFVGSGEALGLPQRGHHGA